MEHFNYYYEDFNNEDLNLTDRVILSVISSFNEYTVNYQELSKLIGIEVSNVKLSVKKLKELNLIQGEEVLQLTNKTQGRYFRVDIERGLEIKQLLVKYYIVSLPNKAFYGSIDTLCSVFSLSRPTIVNLLVQMTERCILFREKYGKTFKYRLFRHIEYPEPENFGIIPKDVNEEQTTENNTIITPTIDKQPTTDINILNQRLNKASEICKQLFAENEKLKADIELLNKKINSLYDRELNYINLFQPVVERIDEINSDLNNIYYLTDNQRAKQETELDMNMLRGLI